VRRRHGAAAAAAGQPAACRPEGSLSGGGAVRDGRPGATDSAGGSQVLRGRHIAGVCAAGRPRACRWRAPLPRAAHHGALTSPSRLAGTPARRAECGCTRARQLRAQASAPLCPRSPRPLKSGARQARLWMQPVSRAAADLMPNPGLKVTASTPSPILVPAGVRLVPCLDRAPSRQTAHATGRRIAFCPPHPFPDPHRCQLVAPCRSNCSNPITAQGAQPRSTRQPPCSGRLHAYYAPPGPCRSASGLGGGLSAPLCSISLPHSLSPPCGPQQPRCALNPPLPPSQAPSSMPLPMPPVAAPCSLFPHTMATSRGHRQRLQSLAIVPSNGNPKSEAAALAALR
jgi:hypothetical protein